MLVNELNDSLRNLFSDLINKGYKKFSMTEVTLGKAFSPQFNKFLEDTDLGLSPLERMVNGLGFELHLIPIKSGDLEFKKIIDQKYEEFLDNSKNDLIDHIENRPVKPTGGVVTKAFDAALEDMFDDLK
jgi:hypothetical protein